MDAADQQRLQLLRKLEEVLGEQDARTLMAHLPPRDWSEFATKHDLAQLGRGLRAEMADLRGELRAEMADLRGELRGEMGELRAEMADLRGELRGEMGELRGEMGELRKEMGELRGTVGGLRGELHLEIARWGRAHVYTTIGAVATTGALAFAAAGLT